MEPTLSATRLELRVMATALVIASLPLCAAFVAAQEAETKAYTQPAAIDRAVAQFTGAQIGEVGGARQASDPRLKLAGCAAPLQVGWYGRNRTSVEVKCDGPQPWRTFVATMPAAVAEAAAPVVTRGDPVTVVVRGRGFSVQQSGEAMEAGAIGEWIAVRMANRSRRDAVPVRARIERPGLAIIE